MSSLAPSGGKRILVVGGAGYVGSSVSAWLIDRGHDVWVLDDLSTGHRENVLGRGFTLARAGDRSEVSALLSREKFDCVMHFAASALVGESVRLRDKYFENNVVQTRILIEEMLKAGVMRFVFSSTCAIFGDPGDRAMNEDLEKKPINPYGETKLEAERVIQEFSQFRGLQATALRYFNAAGAEPGLRTGEWHEPETHLIPNVFRAINGDAEFTLHGGDYATSDGTCVRDYVHVTALARAHEAAMLRMCARPAGKGQFETFNLGTERGSTVLEVVRAVEKVVGKSVRVKVSERRPGDPPRLVADSTKARREIGFDTGDFPLEKIIETAWAWEQKRLESRPAVFLDRDGTLNEDPGYLNHPAQMKLLPGVGDALARLKRAGYQLVVVSNQSGVGRGLIEPENLSRIHERMDDLLKPFGVKIDHYELCVHVPEAGCECRKPSPKLIQDAAQKLNLDLSRSYMVGDKASDVEAGKAAGLKASLLVRTGEGEKHEKLLTNGTADWVAPSLTEATEWIERQ